MAIDGVSSNNMRFWGLASGLDVDEIVRGFMMAERAPLDRLLQRRQVLEWQQEDLRSINLKLRELDELAFQLRLESTFNVRRVSVSDESAVEARVGQGAPIGTHTIKVQQLAQGLRLHSGVPIEDDVPLSEQFDGLSGQVEFTITRVGVNGEENGEEDSGHAKIQFDADKTTIRELVALINSHDLGLTAVYEPDLGRLFLASDATGSEVEYKFDDPDGFLTTHLNLKTEGGTAIADGGTYSGIDAVFTYNGVSITRSTNEFTAGGVSFKLLEADPDKTITVNVTQDVDRIVESIEGLINKYNEIVEHLNSKLLEKRHYDFPPLTDLQREEMSEKDIELWEEKAKSGLLKGDSMLSRILSDLRQALGGVVSGTGSKYTTLSSIGIKTGSWEERGILHLDKDALRSALEEDVAGVRALFRQDGTDTSMGLIRRLESVLDAGMERITNRVGRAGAAVDDSAIGRQIGWISDAIERAEARLAQREAQFYRQFSMLESFMSQMNTQSLWLYQAFGGA